MGEVNETNVLVEGQEVRALIDWFSIIINLIGMGEDI